MLNVILLQTSKKIIKASSKNKLILAVHFEEKKVLNKMEKNKTQSYNKTIDTFLQSRSRHHFTFFTTLTNPGTSRKRMHQLYNVRILHLNVRK